MSHKQKLEGLLTEFGVVYRERASPSQAYASEEGTVEVATWNTSIDLPEGVGLPGFVASFYFDEDETFLAYRVWKKE